jgi:hypothetical protein
MVHGLERGQAEVVPSFGVALLLSNPSAPPLDAAESV